MTFKLTQKGLGKVVEEEEKRKKYGIMHMIVFTDLSFSEKEVSPVRIEAVFLCL